MLDLDAARTYARRHPEDTGHAAVLRTLEPPAAPSRPLNIAAARARMAATGPTSAPAAVEEPPAPARRITYNVGAVRARQEAERAARRPPTTPPSAVRFVAGDSWRWAHVDSRLPDARSWTRLAADLVAAGPLLSLHVRQEDAVGHGGHTRFHHGDGGAVWASIAVDPSACGSSHRTGRVIAHELAHVADELAALTTMTPAAWWRSFTDPHREAEAEAFAVAAEEWLRPDTPAADIITAALRHQEERHVR